MADLPSQFKYRDFGVQYETARKAHLGAADAWFHAVRADAASRGFTLQMLVSDVYAYTVQPDTDPPGSSMNLAERLGTRWVKGLIDLDRFTPGEIYQEERREDWNPLFGLDSMNEEELQYALLDALERSYVFERQSNRIEGISVDGIGDVLGVGQEAVGQQLSLMELRGRVESYAATLGHGLVDGAVRITESGVAFLEVLRERRRQRGKPATQRGVVAVVFTDMVRSTERRAELGDGK